MAEQEIVPLQIWKSKYADISYRVFGGSTHSVEMYDVLNNWDVVTISKDELRKHFDLIFDPNVKHCFWRSEGREL